MPTTQAKVAELKKEMLTVKAVVISATGQWVVAEVNIMVKNEVR